MQAQTLSKLEQLAPGASDTGVRSDDRERWLAERLSGWTASEVPALLGFDRRRSPLAVYAAKMGRAVDLHTEDDLELMRWGNRFEAPILDEYRERTGHDVEQVGALLRSKSHPWLLATLDGVDWTTLQDLEVKTFGWWASQDWEAEEGGIPRYVFCQVQMQLAVTALDSALVLALPLNERKLRVLPVERHAEFQELALAELEEHWERFQAGHLPEPDGHESTRLALDAIYSRADGSVVRLAEEWASLTEEYQLLGEVNRRNDKRRDEIKNQLRADLGSASYGEVGDGRRWSLLESAGPSHTCTSCGHIDRGQGSRRPRLSGKKRS